MKKRISAYLTVEASYIFPLIVFILYLFIISAVLLMVRCLNFQNNFIIGLRVASFSYAEDDYGEIVYGNNDYFDKEEYGISRLNETKKTYLGLDFADLSVRCNEKTVYIISSSEIKFGKIENITEMKMINPVTKIRRSRS